jgi:hypothetical protein
MWHHLEQLGEPHDNVVKPAANIPGYKTKAGTDSARYQGGDQTDRKRSSGTMSEHGGDIPSENIRSEWKEWIIAGRRERHSDKIKGIPGIEVVGKYGDEYLYKQDKEANPKRCRPAQNCGAQPPFDMPI